MTEVSDRELLQELEKVAEQLGENPTFKEMQEHGEHHPNTYKRRFGSWVDAKKKIGLGECARGIDREKLLNAIRELADDLGKTPSTPEMDRKGEFSTTPYKARWGSWNAAVRAAGLDINQEGNEDRRIPREKVLADVEELIEDLGRVPYRYEAVENVPYSGRTFRHKFGSYQSLIHELGETPVEQRNIPTEELLAELERVIDELGRAPSFTEMREIGKYSLTAYYSRFGSWTNAVRKAGETPVAPLTGEDHPLWAGGELGYGEGWCKNRRLARERDKYECQVCGTTEEEHLRIHNESLHVHHIIPARKFDDPEPRNDLDNLITLCRSCHNRWEGIPVIPTTGEAVD